MNPKFDLKLCLQDLVQNGMVDQNTLIAAGSDDIELNPSAKIRELERLNHFNKNYIEEVSFAIFSAMLDK